MHYPGDPNPRQNQNRFSWRSLVRPLRSAHRGTMPAGLVFLIVLGALVIAMFVNADSTARKSEGKPRNAAWRTTVAHDVASVSDFFGLTTPRRSIDSAMGRSDSVGASLDELLAEQSAATESATGTTDTTDPAQLRPVIRTPTPDAPLRIWVGGDSVSQVYGKQLVKSAEATGLFTGTLDGRVSTGLAVPTYFNWPEHLAKDVVPVSGPNQFDVMVTLFGANDGQNIQMPDGKVLQRFTPEWYAEYQLRVGKTMDLLRSPTNDRLILWTGPPPMGPTTRTHGMDHISWIGWTEAQKRPWVHYVDSWPFFSDANFQFQHSFPNADGTVRGMRQKDDIHFSDVGGTRLGWVAIEDMKPFIDLSQAKVQPKPSEIAPPEIKERAELPETMPGAV